MSALSRHYGFGRHTLALSAPSALFLERLEVFIGPLRDDARGNPEFRVDLTEGEPRSPAADAALVYQGPVFEEGVFALYQTGDAYLLRADGVSLNIEPGAQRALLTVAPGSDYRIAGTAGMLALEAAIDSFGQASLHAAGLTLPGSDELVLLYAVSGTGKTTTALALAQAGFGLCSDDAMVLDLSAPLAAWGVPRYLKVHRNSAAMMPWLGAVLTGEWDDEGEQEIALTELRRLVRLESAKPQRIAGLFQLVRTATPSAVAPLGRADALATLAADNVRRGSTGLLPHHNRRFKALARLVAEVPIFELRIGRDIETLAGHVISALQRAKAE